jgi:putative PEP-CTERM system histidine kinase
VLFWQRCGFGAAAFLPPIWLIFALSFAQADFKATLKKWQWILVSIFLIHLIFVTILGPKFFQGAPFFSMSHGWLVRLDWSGQAFHIFSLLSIVLIIVVLERTLRASKGLKRWRAKFLIVGVGSLFVARLYTISQAVLFHTINLELVGINAAALLVADLLILISILRAPSFIVGIHLSNTALYNSITLVAVGVYLLGVGIMAKLFHPLNGLSSFPFNSFIILLALIGLSLALLSDRLRLKLRQLISRHFRRSQYDYRRAWRMFTEQTASLVELRALCDAVCKLVSELLNIPAVSIWLLNEDKRTFRLGGSTVFSAVEVEDLHALRQGSGDFLRIMEAQQEPIDLNRSELSSLVNFRRSYPDFFPQAHIRYGVTLSTGGECLGLMTLGDGPEGERFSMEEQDLIKTTADQVAANLLNLTLLDRLRQAQEMEAFQTVATFFAHDLKNLAAKLSMVLENLPVHFDSEAFRGDALQLLSQSVGKINGMSSRISSLRVGLELRPREADLNEVIRATLASLDHGLNGSLIEKLNPVPKVLIDPEQIQKVITNLVMNAHEALQGGGEIRIATERRDGWVELEVIDNGCGISRDVMERCLFRPFQTTKKDGMGIGLFHSKMIVELHKGRIEVESEEGVGSTFRVLLPVSQA